MTEEQAYAPPPDAIPLLEAMKQFLPAQMWEEHARATEARKNFPQQPSFLRMRGREWQDAIESYRAANQTHSAAPDPQRIWSSMLAAMKSKLEAGELTAFGQENPPFGPWHVIPAHAWRQLRITSVDKGQARTGVNVVHDIHVLPPDADDHMPTGAPGRPTKGMDLVWVEFQRRVEAGETAGSLGSESRALADWYHQSYPRRDGPTAKTIENNIRVAYREARANRG